MVIQPVLSMMFLCTQGFKSNQYTMTLYDIYFHVRIILVSHIEDIKLFLFQGYKHDKSVFVF